jgi:c-di-AMP phosphodiesterase-like protein
MQLTPEMQRREDCAQMFLRKYYKGQITKMKWDMLDNAPFGTLIVQDRKNNNYIQYLGTFIEEVIELKVPKKLFLEWVNYALSNTEESKQSGKEIKYLNLNDYLCSK